MGVLVQGLHSEVDKGRSCGREPPFGIFLSSLLSGRDIILPVVTFSALERIPLAEHNPIIRMADSFLATVSAREENATCCHSIKEKALEFPAADVNGRSFLNCSFQFHSNGGRAALDKDSQHWQTLRGCWDLKKDLCCVSLNSSSQNQLLAAFLEGVQKRFPGLPQQGLPHVIATRSLVSKPNCVADSYELQKPSMMSIFQGIMEHCLLVGSNLSKHAGQLVPWNHSLICNNDDSKEKLVSSSTENNCTGQTLQEGNLKPTTGLFGVPILNIERLRSTLFTVSVTEIIERIPQLGKTSQDFPDKKKLFSVQDFYRYTETEGRRFFEELDRDGDGQVTIEDLEVAMRKRKLPQQYAREFLRRTRKHWFAKSFGWSEFLSLMDQKEPMMLRAYNSLSLSKSGTIQKGQVLSSLRNAGLPATEENAAAMMRYLDTDTEGSIAYGQFRNFMLLLPPERLVDDPRMVWFEAATMLPMPFPVAMPAESVLKSALAGGLTCALSTSLLHPLDTMKTRVQASSTLSFTELISKLPEIGVRGLYRGSVPAILGQFSSHGIRTGIFEASKLLLTSLAPDVPEIQVQSLASLCSTVIGTAVRIPCEVLKQRLQAGLFDSVGDALIGTWQQDGPKGFFRGTGVTLCREVPFYVAGMGIYAELKKVVQRVLNRELAPWETIAVGAMSGGLAAVFTTPFDVMKTRTMTAAPGMSTGMSAIAISILREEGLLGLFKGAVPRFFWIAPLGAMNFAGYELAKRAMENKKD